MYIDRIDADNDFDGSGSQESLQIVTSPTTQVVVQGHFGPYENFELTNFRGRIETIRLADETFTDLSSLQQVTVAASEAGSGKQAKLAAAAEGLAEEARELASKAPKPGPLPGDGGKADKHQAETGTQQHDKSAKHANKDKQENQPKREKKQNTHQKHHKRR